MSGDRHERTRAVTTRLAKRHPTNRKSVRERLKNMWQVGSRESRNVGGPTRTDMGRQHDPSSKTPPDKPKVSLRVNYRWWVSERVEMSADRVDRTRAVTIRLSNCDPINRKSVRQRLRKIQAERYEGG